MKRSLLSRLPQHAALVALRLSLGLALALAAAATGCATSAPGSSSVSAPVSAGRDEPVALLQNAKCTGCHARVEPGQLPRKQVAAAITRHRGRAHLSPVEWAALLDYLAPASLEAPRPDARTASTTPTGTGNP